LALEKCEWSTLHPSWITPRKKPRCPLNRWLGGPQN